MVSIQDRQTAGSSLQYFCLKDSYGSQFVCEVNAPLITCDWCEFSLILLP